jgi:adenylate cyclase class IV
MTTDAEFRVKVQGALIDIFDALLSLGAALQNKEYDNDEYFKHFNAFLESAKSVQAQLRGLND